MLSLERYNACASICASKVVKSEFSMIPLVFPQFITPPLPYVELQFVNLEFATVPLFPYQLMAPPGVSVEVQLMKLQSVSFPSSPCQ